MFCSTAVGDASKTRVTDRKCVVITAGVNKTSLCTFAALCDGNVVTTSGYNIMADLCVNRASAVAHSLKQKYLPVTYTKSLVSQVFWNFYVMFLVLMIHRRPMKRKQVE